MSQAAVFGVLAKKRPDVPVDVRLYLPEKWTDDPARCQNSGIPESERIFRTKDQLAFEIVSHCQQSQLRYGWVDTDAGYGKGPGFCFELDRMGETFVVDLHSDFPIYPEDPKPYVPEQTNRHGRTPTRYRTDVKSLEAKTVAEQMNPSHSRNNEKHFRRMAVAKLTKSNYS